MFLVGLESQRTLLSKIVPGGSVGPCFSSSRPFVPLLVTTGAPGRLGQVRTVGSSSYPDMPAAARGGLSLPFFLLLLCRPAFSRGAEHDRLGVNVGGDRVLVRAWAKEFPNLRLCHHWLQDRENLVSLSPKGNGLTLVGVWSGTLQGLNLGTDVT